MLQNYLLTIKQTVIQACTSDVVVKCVSILFVILANISFGGVDAVVLVGVGMLTMMDMMSALMREYKLGRSIESKKLIKTAVKLTVYGMMVSAAYITESVIMIKGVTIPIVQIVATVISITEFVSILENAGAMGYAIPQKLLNQLRSYTDKQ